MRLLRQLPVEYWLARGRPLAHLGSVMTQLARALVAKSDDPSLATRIWKDRTNSCQVVLWPSDAPSPINKCIKNLIKKSSHFTMWSALQVQTRSSVPLCNLKLRRFGSTGGYVLSPTYTVFEDSKQFWTNIGRFTEAQTFSYFVYLKRKYGFKKFN